MEVKPGYKQTEAGVIPEDWDAKPLREDILLLSGYHVLARNCNVRGEGVPYLTGPADFPDGTIQQTKFTNDPKTLCQDGDLLVTVKGSGSGTLIKAEASYGISRQLMAIRVKEWDAKFLFYSLQQNASRIKAASSGVIPGLSRSDILNQEIPLPNILEQKAISAALSDVDDLITSLDRLIAKKRDIKHAAMKELLTGKRRLPGFESGNGYKQTEVGLIPEDWNAKTLGDVMIHCFSGATPSRSRPDFYKGNIRWITSGELNYNVITDTAEKISSEAVIRTNLKLVPKNTFLMAITGLEAEGTRGSCGIVGEESTTNQSCMAIFPTNELLTKYLFHYYVLKGKALALKYCQGTKQQSYTARIVKLIPIPLPPREEQHAIATVLSDMDSEIAILETRLKKTRALKQGMMQELLTGRIRLSHGGAS